MLIAYLDKLGPATADHPYLRAKAVSQHGVGTGISRGPLNIFAGEDKPQVWGHTGDLIIPLHTVDGQLVGTQSIGPDGRKSFSRGCRWGGGMYLITGRIPTRGALSTIVIAEGYATAATIHELTGLPVAAALTVGNLETVAKVCRDRHPGSEIYIAGDNDHQKERELGRDGRPKKNVGREAATKAAHGSGATTVLPSFAEHEHGSDWNDLEQENARLRKAVSDLTLDKLILQEAAKGKLLSPSRRRTCVEHVRRTLDVSERRICRVLGQHRSTQRKVPRGRDDEERLTADIIELARQYGRYGYRRIA